MTVNFTDVVKVPVWVSHLMDLVVRLFLAQMIFLLINKLEHSASARALRRVRSLRPFLMERRISRALLVLLLRAEGRII